jgi:hypothetical protein
VLVEFCVCTFASNPPGTNSTSETPLIFHGNTNVPVGATAARAWSTEPTALTPLEVYKVTPAGGLFHMWYPPEEGPDQSESDGFAIRCTSANAVDLRAGIQFIKV